MNSTFFKFIFVLCCFASTSVSAAQIDFYGHTLQMELEPLRSVRGSQITKGTIERQLRTLDQSNHGQLLSQVYDAQKEYDLDGMGTVLLTKKISSSVSTSKNTRNLTQYFLLKNLGYDVRLTYTNSSISCFGHMSNKPSSSVYIILDGKRYTNLDFRNMRTRGTRYLYKSGPTSGTPITFSGKAPKIGARKADRDFKWFFQGKMYELQAVNNKSFTDYLNDLPQFELGKEYTKVTHSDEFNESVLIPLRDYLEEMSTNSQKANFLLNFVQSSFGYKTDHAQYGREKYNYPEETISSSYSDCEDRTILLAFLYKELLGFESVMLHFEKEKHVCLGVKIPNRSNSYSFLYKNEAFMVCEPTGRGYKLGDTAIGLNRITDVIDLF